VQFSQSRVNTTGETGCAHVLPRSSGKRLAASARQTFLIIGPWDHAGTRTPRDEVAGVKFWPGAIVDLNDLHRQWYDWTMKADQNGIPQKSVAYYLLAPGNSGAKWRMEIRRQL
jgi:hypothetical protein